MPRGGHRPNAGRKAGSANTKTREIANAAAAEGVTPLEYMLKIMRDEEADTARRDEMARAAAPYIHPRLSAIEAKVEETQRQRVVSEQPIMTAEQWEARYAPGGAAAWIIGHAARKEPNGAA